jgi:hypothetical protein
VEALDNLVRQEVALVLDFLDLVSLVPQRLFGCDISSRIEGPRRISSASAKVVVEPLFLGNSLNATFPGADLSRFPCRVYRTVT